MRRKKMSNYADKYLTQAEEVMDCKRLQRARKKLEVAIEHVNGLRFTIEDAFLRGGHKASSEAIHLAGLEKEIQITVDSLNTTYKALMKELHKLNNLIDSLGG